MVLFQFGYHGFSFLSQAAMLWFMVFSNLALVSLDYYIIISNRVNRKFELRESCYQCKLKLKLTNLNNSLWASSAN